MATDKYPLISYDSQTFLYNQLNDNNHDALYEFIEKYTTDQYLQNYIDANKITKTMDQVAYEFKKIVVDAMIHYRERADIVLIQKIIDRYNFMYTETHFKEMIRFMSIDVLLFFGKYHNLSKYYIEISKSFAERCMTNTVDQLKKFSETGFTVEQLYNNNFEEFKFSPIYYAICNLKPDVLKYLLDMGMDYKKYEIDIIRMCIEFLCLDHLKILINYGLDMTAINNIKITEDDETVVKLYNLMQDYKIDPLITALCFSKIYNEY